MPAKEIVYSDANTMGVITPLFTFDTIYDTDFGMLVYIFREYFDTSIFSEEFFSKNHTINKLVESLATREYENPLLIAMNDNTNYELANELYMEFYEKKYKEILTFSMPTNIAELIEIFNSQSGITVGVLISRPEERYFLEAIDLYPKINYIDINSTEDLSTLNIYNQVYFKSCSDRYITDERILSKLYEKHIYIPTYPFNLDIENDHIFYTKPIAKLMLQRCEFSRYDIYDLSDEEDDEETKGE